MKQNMGKKGFTTKDIIVIILCLIALVALVLIFKKSSDNKQEAQEQLSEISEQIQNEGLDKKDSIIKEGIVINEVNQEGWIEIYNNSSLEINLKGIVLYINGAIVNELDEDIKIGQGALYVLEAGITLNSNNHELIALSDEQGNIIESRLVPKLENGESYGCITDGAIEIGYITPSKGKTNIGEASIQKQEIHFSIPGGFYNNSIQVEIFAPDDCEIYYTLDGSNPTMDSEKYEKPIQIYNRSGSKYNYAAIGITGYEPQSIDMGTVVRAIAVDRDGITVMENTESYFIGLANNSDMVDIPVLSIVTDPDNLFDYFEGIYVLGRSYENMIAAGIENSMSANYLNMWKKSAHVEFFETNKDKTYESEVELSLLWDDNISKRQKGFKIAEIDTNINWSGSVISEYFSDVDKVLNIQTNRNDNTGKIREYLANQLLQETAVGTVELMPVNVFIDGEYWGLYMLRKPYNEKEIQERYNVQNENIIFVKSRKNENWKYQHLYDEFYQFIVNNDMSITANYDQVKNMMDVQSYLDYFCANMYLANANYGVEGSYMWRTITTDGTGYADGKWRWLIGQLDHTMGCNKLGDLSTSSIDTFLQKGVVDDYIFMSLRKNDEFRKQLKETMLKMQEDVFTSEIVEKEMNSITEKISKAAISSYARFSGLLDEKYYVEYKNDILSFFNERGIYMSVYVEEVCTLDGEWEQILESLNQQEEYDSSEEKVVE